MAEWKGNLRTSTRARVRYEYKCPYCGHANIRYEECARIVCDLCKREFIPHWIIPNIGIQHPTRPEGGGLPAKEAEE